MLSIITIAKCAPKELLDTALSVETQCGAVSHEHILIVNKSMARSELPSDSTNRQVIVCDDSGVYDAMNRGIAISRGTHLWFLNSGDVAINSSRDLIDLAMGDNTAISLGYTINVDARGREVGRWPVADCGWNLLSGPILAHQAAIFPRGVFDSVGLYDTRYRINGDYDHFVRCAIAGIPFRKIDIAGARYKLGGMSDSRRWRATKRREHIAILLRNRLISPRAYLQCSALSWSHKLFHHSFHRSVILSTPPLCSVSQN